jgi:hypothetical protein
MALSPQQSARVASQRPGVRASLDPNSLAGAAYGMYTPRDGQEMLAWAQQGPPDDWYDHLWNTGRFVLGMPGAQQQHLLYVRNAGFPTGESYHVQGGRGDGSTLPKINALASPPAVIAATLPLAGATADSINNWVIAQI